MSSESGCRSRVITTACYGVSILVSISLGVEVGVAGWVHAGGYCRERAVALTLPSSTMRLSSTTRGGAGSTNQQLSRRQVTHRPIRWDSRPREHRESTNLDIKSTLCALTETQIRQHGTVSIPRKAGTGTFSCVGSRQCARRVYFERECAQMTRCSSDHPPSTAVDLEQRLQLASPLLASVL